MKRTGADMANFSCRILEPRREEGPLKVWLAIGLVEEQQLPLAPSSIELRAIVEE